MTRRITRSRNLRSRTTLASKYVGNTSGVNRHRSYNGAGLGRWISKAGKTIFKGVKTAGKFVVKNKLLSSAAAMAATKDLRFIPAAVVLKAVGLGKCSSKTCSKSRMCRNCKQSYALLKQHGSGLKLTGNGMHGGRTCGKKNRMVTLTSGRGLNT